jgi:GNAT superfamily N-acetyltransferase
MTAPIITQENIQILGAPQIPGLIFRHYQGEVDLPAILELGNLADMADEAEEVQNLEQITHQFAHFKNCDPARDILLGEVDGQLVTFSRVWWMLEDESAYVYRSWCYIHPDWRNRGLGTALLAYNQNRLREIAQEQDHPARVPNLFETWGGPTMPGANAVLENDGYQPVRYFFTMVRSIEAPLPNAPMPKGLDVRPFEETHNRPIWEAINEAFQDHWGYSEGTEEDYERFLTRPSRKPHLWQVAWDGNEVAGMILNGFFEEENETFNRQRGWTDPICTRQPWRRRGLARALLVKSIEMFREMGFDDTALGVDTQNPNGALKLYESVGYETNKTWISYRKPIED